MPNYFYNNKPVPESQLLRLSQEKSMSLDEFLKSMPGIEVRESEAKGIDIAPIESVQDRTTQPNVITPKVIGDATDLTMEDVENIAKRVKKLPPRANEKPNALELRSFIDFLTEEEQK